jgi:hypothetical protein
MKDQPAGATSTKTTFEIKVEIRLTILASREKVWSLLTQAGDFHKWNSTILSMEGTFALNEVIKVKTSLDTSRTIKLRVTSFSPPERMVWSDGIAPFFKGNRTFQLTALPDGKTELYRQDVFSGLLFPLVAGSLPDFKVFFESFAAALKAEAERE